MHHSFFDPASWRFPKSITPWIPEAIVRRVHCIRPNLRATGYTSRDNPTAAEAVVDFIIARAELLIRHPMMGKIMKPGGPRELILSRYPYNIIYRIARAHVRIVRVIHQSRQFP